MSTAYPIEPEIVSVQALPGHCLQVHSSNSDARLHDFVPHLAFDVSSLLKIEAFLNAEQVDLSGYGFVRNDEMDIAASELRLNGKCAGAFAPPALQNTPFL